jgi:hypothetical protein
MLRLPNTLPVHPIVSFSYAAGRNRTGMTMRLIGSLIDRLQRWIARYKVTLDYAHARARREPPHEIEWNGAMIGDLRRRSSDA